MEAGFAIARQRLHPEGLCDQISSLGLCFPKYHFTNFKTRKPNAQTGVLLNQDDVHLEWLQAGYSIHMSPYPQIQVKSPKFIYVGHIQN